MIPKLIAYAFLTLSAITTAQTHNTTLLHQFPNGTWVENIAVRHNNQLLLSLLTSPDLYILDPSTPNPEPTLLHTFANATAVFGIAEYSPDVFAVSVGNYSFTSGSIAGSYAIYRVDFTACTDDSRLNPRISLIAPVPDAVSINGICTLPSEPSTLLLGDITKGQIFRFDTHTGESTVVVPPTHPLTAIADSAFGPAGVDGIHILGDFLYAANVGTGVFGKLAITSQGTPVPGTDPVIIAHAANGTNWDDFALDGRGNAYAVTSSGNTVVKISPEGKQTVIAGRLDSMEIAEPTSVVLSRGEERLFVVTGGGLFAPVNGKVVGGQVIAIDL
ncbi:hypothetical protein CC80DRAFT_546551 [Byssothecium circinans]|uniref:SMP-30/Gluconolactonase/LRE-like region domain-containing protein n=1 Tax=Byssothecium circinans TaxID=147558 RepID=A0A6A5U1Z4_9PLEO|nr:hypothetical protein CC80DRAFT_546551 [Byssothecium circinans]